MLEKKSCQRITEWEDWEEAGVESALQFRRATSLIVFYNLMVHDSKSRIEAPTRCSRLGKARSMEDGYQKMGQVFEKTGELPSSQRGAHSKVFSLLSLPEVAHAMRAYCARINGA